MTVINLALSEALLTLRTWAVCGRGRFMTIFLTVLYTSFIIPSVVNMGLLYDNLTFISLPRFLGETCLITGNGKHLAIEWILLIVYDAIMCGLLGIQAISAYRYGGTTRLARIVYGEGVMYYLYLMVLSITATVLILQLPPGFLRLTAGPSQVIHYSLTARVILHVRDQANRGEFVDYSFSIPSSTPC
ncbi:hypothetical protein AMATHDRAFT_200831 [Amanita thiersii Skay4041]|uniref:Uncharacterized protein n=1 Tax=Amanita thiersii Skay4041 TaxID=703135 RepID=A0A2A9NBH8_9AGAR|nr:hypothetical protein AMATHDRAFT_200831 [Amanita thiersii Skay4041]